MASESLRQNAAASILNLRSINPYVSMAVADWQKVRGPKALLPRQLGANAANRSKYSKVAGASSFGMSGVNAHAILRLADSEHEVGELKAPTWQRSR